MENAILEVMESQMITIAEVSQNINVENDTQGSEQAVVELKVTDDGFKQKKLKTSHKTLVARRASSRVAGIGTPIYKCPCSPRLDGTARSPLF